jgi:uncharacterized membrane protein YccF (DUF307 family)
MRSDVLIYGYANLIYNATVIHVSYWRTSQLLKETGFLVRNRFSLRFLKWWLALGYIETPSSGYFHGRLAVSIAPR